MSSAQTTDSQIIHHRILHKDEPTPVVTPIIKVSDFVIARLKAQILTSFTYGFWLSILSVVSWNISGLSVIKVAILYLLMLLLVYIPTSILLTYTLLKPLRPQIKLINQHQNIAIKDLNFVVRSLTTFPLHQSSLVFAISLTTIIVASSFFLTGFITEFEPIIHIVVFQTIMIGVVISIIESILNYALTKSTVSTTLEDLVHRYPQARNLKINIKRFTWSQKVSSLVILLPLASQLGLSVFFTAYVFRYSPDNTSLQVFIIVSLLVVNLTYLHLMGRYLTHLFTNPLKHLLDFSHSVANGDMNARISLITDDEMIDIAHTSNEMMDSIAQSNQILNTSYQKLEEEHTRLGLVLRGISDGIVALNPQNKVQLINEAAQLIFDVSANEAFNKNLDLFVSIEYSPHNAIVISKVISHLNRADSKDKSVELLIKTRSGNKKWLQINGGGSAFNNELNILTVRDITKSKELEEMKLDFVTMAAHELRTPITVLHSYISYLQPQIKDFVNVTQSKMLYQIQDSSEQLRTLVDRLLSITNIEQNKVSFTPTPIKIVDLIVKTIDELQPIANDRNIQIKYEHNDQGLPTLMADPLAIKEVIENLVTNAIKYSPEKSTITISNDLNNEMIYTSITDCGIGIPAEDLPHLFTRFYRVPTNLINTNAGTGVGLYLCKLIINQHGGIIKVDSKVGVGSTFTFGLPIKYEKDTHR